MGRAARRRSTSEFHLRGPRRRGTQLQQFYAYGRQPDNAYLAPNASPYTLVEAGALLSGSFSIAVVPEPETYAMFLAGLGLLGFMSRRSLS